MPYKVKFTHFLKESFLADGAPFVILLSLLQSKPVPFWLITFFAVAFLKEKYC